MATKSHDTRINNEQIERLKKSLNDKEEKGSILSKIWSSDKSHSKDTKKKAKIDVEEKKESIVDKAKSFASENKWMIVGVMALIGAAAAGLIYTSYKKKCESDEKCKTKKALKDLPVIKQVMEVFGEKEKQKEFECPHKVKDMIEEDEASALEKEKKKVKFLEGELATIETSAADIRRSMGKKLARTAESDLEDDYVDLYMSE